MFQAMKYQKSGLLGQQGRVIKFRLFVDQDVLRLVVVRRGGFQKPLKEGLFAPSWVWRY